MKPQENSQINYWPTPKKDQGSSSKLQPNSSTSNLPGQMEYARPEDYQLPRDYRIPSNGQSYPNQRDYQAPYFNQGKV